VRGMIKAIALLSGGLDSTLAVKIVSGLGIDVEALNFYTGFCIVEQRRRVGGKRAEGKPIRNEALRAGADLGVKVELIDISKEYLRMVTKPKHGYGSAINPCIDCRIFMLKKAKEYMEEVGARFIITGEVLGQRPMSQHRDAMNLIEKESGLKRLILRPLSAQLLPQTLPEENGWVDREKLFDIKGRSRKPQMELARIFGITDYPQPAGGCCFLTDKNYARRFKDLITHRKDKSISHEDIILLGVGRHFRLSDNVKVIVGRDESENIFLERYNNNHWIARPLNYPGPVIIAEGEPEEKEMELIAALTAWYSDGRNSRDTEVLCQIRDVQYTLKPHPLLEDKLNEWRI